MAIAECIVTGKSGNTKCKVCNTRIPKKLRRYTKMTGNMYTGVYLSICPMCAYDLGKQFTEEEHNEMFAKVFEKAL